MKGKVLISTLFLFCMLAASATSAAAAPRPGPAGIDVEKYIMISVPGIGPADDYIDADTAPGPLGLVGSEIYLKYRVQNTGSVVLTHIELIEAQPGVQGCIAPTVLMPGASFECRRGPLPLGDGQHDQPVTAIGQLPGGATVQDSDGAFFFGAVVRVDIETYVGIRVPSSSSNDRNFRWYDADDPPGLTVATGSELHTRWVVTNRGNISLLSLRVKGSAGTPMHCAIVEPVLPGQSTECICAPFPAERGLQRLEALAEGRVGSWTAQDSDPVFYMGIDPTADGATAKTSR